VLYLFISVSLFSEENEFIGLFFADSSISYISQKNYCLSFGIELFFCFYNNEKNKEFYSLLGCEYKFNPTNNNYKIIQWYYCYFPYFFANSMYTAFGFPVGINMAYNITNNNFCIGPKIGYYQNILYFMRILIDYSYNIVINNYNKNYHQLSLGLGIMIYGY
jgi:hypothetical protein